jgi:hypothetical protein
MFLSAATRPGLVRQLARWWREWVGGRNAGSARDGCGPAETARIARDLDIGGAEFRVLAGKWPNSSELPVRPDSA